MKKALKIQLVHCNLEVQTNVGAPGNKGGLPLGGVRKGRRLTSTKGSLLGPSLQAPGNSIVIFLLMGHLSSRSGMKLRLRPCQLVTTRT